MKAAYLKEPYKIEMIEMERPKPGPGEVLIQVEMVGVCGSEVHAYKGRHPFRIPPIITGHELAGDIVELGPEVTTVKVGERVTVEPQVACGRCIYCQEGTYNVCKNKIVLGTSKWMGPFAEYVVVPEKIIYRLPDHLSYEEGVMVEPLAVGVHAVRLAGIKLGDSVAILGSGTIGLVTLIAARESGGATIIATDTVDFNLEMARKMGANLAVNVKKEDLLEEVKRNTGGEGVDCAIVTAGFGPVVKQAIQVVKRRGKVVVIAIFEEPIQFDINSIVVPEVSLLGSQVYVRKDFQAALDLISSGKVKVKSLITHIMPIEKAQQALEIVDRKLEDVVKILLRFH